MRTTLIATSVLAFAACSAETAAVDAGVDAWLPATCASDQPFVTQTDLILRHDGWGQLPTAFSPDELTVYYDHVGPDNRPAVWTARRPSTDQPFGPGQRLESIDSTLSEYDAYESADGEELFFARGDSAGPRIHRASRVAAGGEFTGAVVISLERYTRRPNLSPDGKEIFYESSPVSTQYPFIYHATRDGGPFMNERAILRSDNPLQYTEPVISADGLRLYIADRTQGAVGISYLHRPLRGGPWTGPRPLDGGAGLRPVWESPDGCRLYTVDESLRLTMRSRR